MDSPIIAQPVSPRSGKKILFIVIVLVLIAAVGGWFLVKYFASKRTTVEAERQKIIEQILKDSAETPSISSEDKQAIIDQIIKAGSVPPAKKGGTPQPAATTPTPAERQAILDAMLGAAQ